MNLDTKWELDSIWTAAAQQSIYRGLLNAFSYPGRVREVVQKTDGPVHLAVLATLLDVGMDLADPHKLLSDRERNLLGCREVRVEQSAMILCDGRVPPADGFQPRTGDLYRPDLGATLILCCERIESEAEIAGSETHDIEAAQPKVRSKKLPSECAVDDITPNVDYHARLPALELRVTGPGVRLENRLTVFGLGLPWLNARARWVADFPAGVDLLLCDSTRIVALPRTSNIAASEREL